jgi:hypothetical protein
LKITIQREIHLIRQGRSAERPQVDCHYPVLPYIHPTGDVPGCFDFGRVPLT